MCARQSCVQPRNLPAAPQTEQSTGKGPTNPFAAAGGGGGAAAAASGGAAAAPASDGTPNILDLFGMSGDQAAASAAAPSAAAGAGGADKASDDLLQLSGANPFASVLNAGANGNAGAPAAAAAPATGASPFAAEFSNANGKQAKHNLVCMYGFIRAVNLI